MTGCSHLKQIAQRILNAEDTFAESVMRITGCDVGTAHQVTALYLQEKIATMDAGIGRIRVKHGAFLEQDVLHRAIKMVKAKETA